jgi:hypothetical protein
MVWLEDEDRRADRFARLQLAVRDSGILERILLMDVDLDAAVRDVVEHSRASGGFSIGSAM